MDFYLNLISHLGCNVSVFYFKWLISLYLVIMCILFSWDEMDTCNEIFTQFKLKCIFHKIM